MTFKTIVCLMGPTASGKTALGFELLKHFPIELVSVDSAMIYRGMDIGTAKPSKEEQSLAPHHLIDIRDPIEAYSAAEFCKEAKQLCCEIIQRGNMPLLLGGTMMYFHAFLQGLASLPEADACIRAQLEEALSRFGLDALYQRLRENDPITADRIHPHDKQRVLRALEIFEISGKPLSQWLEDKQTDVAEYRYINLGLFPADRAQLHQQIATRFNQMLAQGFIEEVEALQQQWPLKESMPSMRCVGYRQILGDLQGQYDKQTMVERAIAATRQLAKRQLTWLRHWQKVTLFDPQQPGVVEAIVRLLFA